MSAELKEWNISYKQLGIILMSFILGLIVALFILNSQASVQTNFTTTELISFVLSVILSGASIVLAIAAISLGKLSEQAVISRSDESIRLQTKVYTKTTDALQCIKASTGVTEKRIEDIISGRAGDLSRQIAEMATDETASGNLDVKELEEKIRNSIAGSLEKEESEEEVKRRKERRQKRLKLREEYNKHHKMLLYKFANSDDTKIIKIGHGTPDSTDEEIYSRYDGVFNKGENIIAVSTFMPEINEAYQRKNISEIITNLAIKMEPENISNLYLIFFEESEGSEIIINSKKSLTLIKDELASRIIINPVKYSEIDDWFNKQEF